MKSSIPLTMHMYWGAGGPSARTGGAATPTSPAAPSAATNDRAVPANERDAACGMAALYGETPGGATADERRGGMINDSI